jgi:hypothetical protein
MVARRNRRVTGKGAAMTYLAILTIGHTAISLVAIATGAIAVVGLFRGGAPRFWTQAFFVTALATTITGFFFPFRGVTPAFITGIIALAVLASLYAASQRLDAARAWRAVYAIGTVVSLYLLTFVLLVQLFQKIGFFNRFAPTQTEPPFTVTQLITLVVFIGLAIAAARSYRPAAAPLNTGALGTE